MKGPVVTAVSVTLSLAGTAGPAGAQDENVAGISTNADGSYVTSTSGVNPTADGGGGTIIYGDINTGPRYTVIGPPTVATTAPPPDPAPVAAPEPAPVTTTDTTSVETAVADTAVATETDLDADNYLDSLEWDLGLDPNNADTDADGLADGDELNLYSTAATVYDTDRDGISDGEELFGTLTDPLVWNDFTADSTEADAQETVVEASQFSAVAPVESEAFAQRTTENVPATDSNGAGRGPGNASAAPGSVTRPGSSVLGLDGRYSVTENTPSKLTIAGDTEVLDPSPTPAASPADSMAGCDSYGTWYDAQVAYEAAGMTSADPTVVTALDPDYDGIACEEGM